MPRPAPPRLPPPFCRSRERQTLSLQVESRGSAAHRAAGPAPEIPTKLLSQLVLMRSGYTKPPRYERRNVQQRSTPGPCTGLIFIRGQSTPRSCSRWMQGESNVDPPTVLRPARPRGGPAGRGPISRQCHLLQRAAASSWRDMGGCLTFFFHAASGTSELESSSDYRSDTDRATIAI
jgi:hypothetical protein